MKFYIYLHPHFFKEIILLNIQLGIRSPALCLHNEITSWNRVSLEKLIVDMIGSKFPVFYETQRCISMFTRTRYWTLSYARLIHVKNSN
jgi:hypothetical protein